MYVHFVEFRYTLLTKLLNFSYLELDQKSTALKEMHDQAEATLYNPAYRWLNRLTFLQAFTHYVLIYGGKGSWRNILEQAVPRVQNMFGFSSYEVSCAEYIGKLKFDFFTTKWAVLVDNVFCWRCMST
jgi:hypothetical protein